jgi:hypothetical protein
MAVSVVGFLCVTSTACSQTSEVQKDIPGHLDRVAAANGQRSYFLGRSYSGIDLTFVEDDGSFFVYGTCEVQGESGCAPPIQVQNDPANLPGAVRGCSRLADIRGVPAVSLGGGLVLFTKDVAVTIFPDGEVTSDGDLRSMAEVLRPVSGPADVSKPLPAPANDLLDTIAAKCGASPGDHGKPIED